MSIQSQKRKNFVWAFIGMNRTGKTSTAVEVAKKWKKSRPSYYKCVAFDPQESFKKAGVVTHLIQPSNQDWAKHLLQKNSATGEYLYKHCLLILDDYRILHPQDSMDRDFLNLLQYRAHLDMDIIYICHAPELILERLSYYTTHYSVFYSVTQKDGFQKKIPKYHDCQKARLVVNSYYLKHKDSIKYPKFPHVIVKNDEDGITPMNMDQKKIDEIFREKGWK